jgi:predicted Zn-dependent protease
MSTGQAQAALAAFSDALKLDSSDAGARMERAQLRVLTGDLKGALEDTDFVLAAHPDAEAPWNLRTLMALQIGSPAMAAAALEASTQRWSSDAEAWQQLARLYRGLGEEALAQQALQRAYALRPSLPSLQRGPSP